MQTRLKSELPLLICFQLLLFLIPVLYPDVLSIREIDGAMNEFTFRNFFVDEPIIYVTREQTLYVMNSSGLQKLTILGEQTSSKPYLSFLMKHKDFLFMIARTDSNDYFVIVDVSDPAKPTFIGEAKLPLSYGIGVDAPPSHGLLSIDDNLYYFIQEIYKDYFLCINCTDFYNPELLEYQNFPGEAGNHYNEIQRFCVRDNLVFIATRNISLGYGFVVYNFTSIQAYSKVCEWYGETNLSSPAQYIYLSQEYLYLDRYHTFIEIFNIQNITNPTRRGYIDLGYCNEVFFRENYTFAFYGPFDYPNLTIFDYSNITNLETTSSYLHPGGDYGSFNFNMFLDCMITENYVYIPIAMSQFGGKKCLYVLDWSDPYNLYVKARLDFPVTSTDGFSSISVVFLICVITLVISTIKVRKSKKYWRNLYS